MKVKYFIGLLITLFIQSTLYAQSSIPEGYELVYFQDLESPQSV